MSSTKQRPVGVTVLAVLAGLAAVVALWHALQMLHILPFGMGEHRFWGFDPIGALLWGFLGGIYVWLVRALWQLDPQAWFFLAVIAAFNLVMGVTSLLGGSTLSALWPSLLVNGIILVYVLLPGTRKVFE
jgi:hypothetical protein